MQTVNKGNYTVLDTIMLFVRLLSQHGYFASSIKNKFFVVLVANFACTRPRNATCDHKKNIHPQRFRAYLLAAYYKTLPTQFILPNHSLSEHAASLLCDIVASLYVYADGYDVRPHDSNEILSLLTRSACVYILFNQNHSPKRDWRPLSSLLKLQCLNGSTQGSPNTGYMRNTLP